MTGCNELEVVESSFYDRISSFDSSLLVSSEILTFDEIDFTKFGLDLDYEEYFSEERYVDERYVSPVSSSNMGHYSWDSFNSFYIQVGRTREEKVLIYQHPERLEGSFCEDEYLIYFLANQSLYRIFVPELILEEIYQDEEMAWFRPITNYYTIIMHKNPAFQEALDLYGDGGMPENHPPQYLYFLYDCRDESLVEINEKDAGVRFSTFPVEEIRPTFEKQ